MQAVILAGGFGTRISEESIIRPKPLIELDGNPIIYHLMESLSLDGINEFIICLGYKGFQLKKFFLNMKYYLNDLEVDLGKEYGDVNLISQAKNNWKITLVDTGLMSNTAKRVKKIGKYIKEDKFLLTYGDGLSNVQVSNILSIHEHNNAQVTVTAVRPSPRFGALELDGYQVTKFSEKNDNLDSWINGGYFIVNKSVIDLIDDSLNQSWESDLLPIISKDGGLYAYKHTGFWHPMDTMKDKKYLESIINKGTLPWLEKNEN